MTRHSLTIMFSLLLITISRCFHGLSAMDYQVTNLAPDLPGGKRLAEVIGIQGAKVLMSQANAYIWFTIFQQNSPETRKPIDSVLLFFVNNSGYKSWNGGNKINISANYIPEKKEDVKLDFATCLYHEMTRVLQWTGKGKCPHHLLEGVGYFTNIKIKLIPKEFSKPGDGDKWDQEGYVTARFLEYCDEVSQGFVAKLNEKMKTTYDVSFFKEITGKSVDQLWKDYKSKHRNNIFIHT